MTTNAWIVCGLAAFDIFVVALLVLLLRSYPWDVLVDCNPSQLPVYSRRCS